MAKTDWRKEYRQLYTPSAKAPAMVEVPALQFLMFDGQGDPNSGDFGEAMGTLYPVGYTLKFMLKEEGHDWVVMPPEALWWADDMDDFLTGDKSNWQWTAMMMQPDVVTAEHFAAAVQQVREKKDPPGLGRLRFETFEEGPSAQIMHLGPYSEEGPTIEKLHAFIAEQGYARHGKHHEIYLGDPRRTKPGKLKTVLRQPVGPADG